MEFKDLSPEEVELIEKYRKNLMRLRISQDQYCDLFFYVSDNELHIIREDNSHHGNNTHVGFIKEQEDLKKLMSIIQKLIKE